MRTNLILFCFLSIFSTNILHASAAYSSEASASSAAEVTSRDMIAYHQELERDIRSEFKDAFDNLGALRLKVAKEKEKLKKADEEFHRWWDREINFVYTHSPKEEDKSRFNYDVQWASFWVDYENKRAKIVEEIIKFEKIKASWEEHYKKLDDIRKRKDELKSKGNKIWDKISNDIEIKWNEILKKAYEERDRWRDREFKFVYTDFPKEEDKTRFNYDEQWASYWEDYETERAKILEEINKLEETKASGEEHYKKLGDIRKRKDELLSKGMNIWDQIFDDIENKRKETRDIFLDRSQKWHDRELKFVYTDSPKEEDKTRFNYDAQWASYWEDYETERDKIVEEINKLEEPKSGEEHYKKLDDIRKKKEELFSEGRNIWTKIDSDIRSHIDNDENELKHPLDPETKLGKDLRKALQKLLMSDMKGLSRQSETAPEKNGEKKIKEWGKKFGHDFDEVRFITFETFLNYLPLEDTKKNELKELKEKGTNDKIFERLKKNMISPPFNADFLRMFLSSLNDSETNALIDKIFDGISEDDKKNLIEQIEKLRMYSEKAQESVQKKEAEKLVNTIETLADKYDKHDKYIPLLKMDIVEEFNKKIDSQIKKILDLPAVGRNLILTAIANLESKPIALMKIYYDLMDSTPLRKKFFLNVDIDEFTYYINNNRFDFNKIGIGLSQDNLLRAGIDPEKFENSSQEYLTHRSPMEVDPEKLKIVAQEKCPDKLARSSSEENLMNIFSCEEREKLLQEYFTRYPSGNLTFYYSKRSGLFHELGHMLSYYTGPMDRFLIDYKVLDDIFVPTESVLEQCFIPTHQNNFEQFFGKKLSELIQILGFFIMKDEKGKDVLYINTLSDFTLSANMGEIVRCSHMTYPDDSYKACYFGMDPEFFEALLNLHGTTKEEWLGNVKKPDNQGSVQSAH